MRVGCQRISMGALALLILAGLSACGARDAPRNGGGSCHENYEEGLFGLRPRLTIRYALAENQWPALGKLLKNFGSEAGLEAFDHSVTESDRRVFEVALCDPRGIVILTRQQVWDPQNDPDEPMNANTYVFQQHQYFGWRAVGEALVKEFEAQGWNVTAEWFQPRIELNGSD